MPRDYYEVLGVKRGATAQQIKKAYRKISMDTHPDRYIADEERTAKFKEAAEAYAVLGDAEKRRAYDAQWKQQPHSNHDAGRNGGKAEEPSPTSRPEKKSSPSPKEDFDELLKTFKSDPQKALEEIRRTLDLSQESMYYNWYVDRMWVVPDADRQRLNVEVYLYPHTSIDKHGRDTCKEYFDRKGPKRLHAALESLGATEIDCAFHDRLQPGGERRIKFSINADTDPRLVECYDDYHDRVAPKVEGRERDVPKELLHKYKTRYLMTGTEFPHSFKQNPSFIEHLKFLMREHGAWKLVDSKGNDGQKHVVLDIRKPLARLKNGSQLEDGKPVSADEFIAFYSTALEHFGVIKNNKRRDLIIIDTPAAFERLCKLQLVPDEIAAGANYGKNTPRKLGNESPSMPQGSAID